MNLDYEEIIEGESVLRRAPAGRHEDVCAALHAAFAAALRDSVPPTVHGDGRQSRDFLFVDEPVVDADAWAKATGTAEARAVFDGAVAAYDALADWTADALKSALEQIGEAHGLKLGKAQAPVRVAVTGRTVGPPLFESLEHLGRVETLRRLGAGVARLG